MDTGIGSLAARIAVAGKPEEAKPEKVTKVDQPWWDDLFDVTVGVIVRALSD